MLTTANAAGTNGLTCLPKHGGCIYPLSRIHNTSLVSAYFGLDKRVCLKYLFLFISDEAVRQLTAEIEDANTRRAELESRVLALERDRDRLEQEKLIQEQKAQEVSQSIDSNLFSNTYVRIYAILNG
jgi:hypothetical protein